MFLRLSATVAAAATIYAIHRLFRNYFKRSPLDSLPGPQPPSKLLGHMSDLGNRQSWKKWAEFGETYGPAFVLKSLLGGRLLVVRDPKALHTILVKDQDAWPMSLGDSPGSGELTLGPGILSALGEQHKRQRKLLVPVFSIAHLRNMAPIFYGVAHKVRDAIKSRVQPDGSFLEMDMNDWMGRTTLEMLGQAGLGYSFDDFSGDSMDDYGESLKLFFPTVERAIFMALSYDFFARFLPRNWIRFIYKHTPSEPTRKIMQIADTMALRSQQIINEKKSALAKGDAALEHQVGEGKDIMSICLRANMAAAENEKMSDEELLAQMSTFILAGMDTTSNALSRILYLLALHPDVQEKLSAEILDAQGSREADLPYDDLVKLPYLDAVCRETLRVYAPVILSARMASKDTVVPLSQPVRGRDGREIFEITVERGTPALLHYQASNVDKALWGDDAEEWKPERWLAPLPADLDNARIPGVYAHLMTFGAGSRSCIGFKFSQLEMKVVLATLLATFEFKDTGKPVAWNSSVVIYPTMGEESKKPEMLLNVKRCTV